jgi:hypothetical protein
MEWISVEDRYPISGMDVLVICMDGWVDVADYYPYAGWVTRDGSPPGADNRNPVTHWMPLPSAPILSKSDPG